VLPVTAKPISLRHRAQTKKPPSPPRSTRAEAGAVGEPAPVAVRDVKRDGGNGVVVDVVAPDNNL